MKNTYRIFSFVLYDDSENLCFKDVFHKVSSNNLFDYFYICHDKDKNKRHYHLAVYLKNPTTISKISKILEIPENFISVKDKSGERYTLKNTIKYFIHYNIEDKEQYSIDELFSNNNDLVKKYYDLLTGGKDEKTDLSDILTFIEVNRITSIKEVLEYCVNNDLLKTYKKYAYTLNQIMRENYRYL